MKVAINGFGRIGRAFFNLASKNSEIEIVAINDLGDIENLAYLLKYDTVYRDNDSKIEVVRDEGHAKISVDSKESVFLSEKNPVNLPWKELGIDVVVESTGFFTKYELAKAHLDAGARKVVVSAPVKDDPSPQIPGATVLMGINDDELKTCKISSNASCTTNAGSPLMAILDEKIGIEKALLNTVHGYTASQGIVDSPNKKNFRLGRAAAQNIVPTTTGAAIATTKVLTNLDGKFDGIAMRVPVVAGSIVDVTFIAKRSTNVEEVNRILSEAAEEERWKNVFSVTEDELVSSDILGSPYASIADLKFTKVVDGNLVKVLSWYDNEMGYTHTLVDHVIKTGKHIK